MEAHDTVIALYNYVLPMRYDTFNLNWLLRENGGLENEFERLGARAAMEKIQSHLNSVSDYLLIELYPYLVANGHPPNAGGEYEAMYQIYIGVQELGTMLSSILVRLTFFMLEREELIEPFDQFRMFVKILLGLEIYKNSLALNRVDHLLEVCRAKFFEEKANRMLRGIMPAERINETTPSSDHNDRTQVLTHLLKDIVEEIIRLTSICQIFNNPYQIMRHEVSNFVKRRIQECHSALREIGEQKLSQHLRVVFAYQVDDEYRRDIEFLNEMTEETISTLWIFIGYLYFRNIPGIEERQGYNGT